MLTVGSLFSGIGGFDLGLERAGFQVRWQVEIDPDAKRVLRRWFEREPESGGTADGYLPTADLGRREAGSGLPRSGAELFSNVARVGSDNLAAVDLVCGGFPCQDLSVAGKRAGLAGGRSGLWFEFHRILAELAPRWVVIENVPGLLSSNSGADMAVVLGGLAELGYGWAYRVLDAQYFGVAQRRRRVFIVGCLGDSAAAAQVLFEPESCDGDSPPSRAPRETIAAGLTAGSHPGSNAAGRHREDDVNLAVIGPGGEDVSHARGASHTATGHLDPTVETFVVAPTVRSNFYGDHHGDEGRLITHTLRAEGSDASEDGTGRGTPLVASVAVRGRADGQEWELGEEGRSNALRAGDGGSSRANWALTGATVRRLTPTECERLQGFPDGWTDQLSDSARYRVLGNAVCVPVAEWIGRRINV